MKLIANIHHDISGTYLMAFLFGKDSLPARINVLKQKFIENGFPEPEFKQGLFEMKTKGKLVWKNKAGQHLLLLILKVTPENKISAIAYSYNVFGTEEYKVKYPMLKFKNMEEATSEQFEKLESFFPMTKSKLLFCQIFVRSIFMGRCIQAAQGSQQDLALRFHRSTYHNQLSQLSAALPELDPTFMIKEGVVCVGWEEPETKMQEHLQKIALRSQPIQ